MFDCSARFRGTSLNEQVYAGPDRANDLMDVLLRFRRHKYAMTADISEMFLQIGLEEADMAYHRFWHEGNDYEWTRVLFGENSSPTIAQKVLQENAEKWRTEFPMAAEACWTNTYVDDTAVSTQDEETLIRDWQRPYQGKSKPKRYCSQTPAQFTKTRECWASSGMVTRIRSDSSQRQDWQGATWTGQKDKS